ncbi:Protein phosphatase 2C family protein [Babesia bovis T2Bo]|uniref:protein-serine/threonine phosphatase n=1 Tax=Babesia bovis TaxID=5865 RepID=A7AX92_BABBO|nr:Protein phosphatase 2C family protein [Babesia bovis T2Bo]EDO05165.1 Protein phosphatase 2C family protein [Babesia bovis T2Bo]|eukprot:XP_001608733.1 protein phosphatase 2C [Babesia bovis T2Bo]
MLCPGRWFFECCLTLGVFMLRRRIQPALSFLNFYSHLFAMGAHLSSPKTDKVSCNGGNFSAHTTRYGASSMQGWRVSMEDAHLAIPDLYREGASPDSVKDGSTTPSRGDGRDANLIGVYGVFDGHGGSCVSKWVSENFAVLLKSEIARYNALRESNGVELKNLDTIDESHAVVAESLQSAFLKVDEELQKPDTEHALLAINERNRSENPNEPILHHDSSLFKVLLPERMPNRQQTLRLIEQQTQRLLREQFSFHPKSGTDPDYLEMYNEPEGHAEAKPEDEDSMDDSDASYNVASKRHEAAYPGSSDSDNFTEDPDADHMVTRSVNEDESMTSGDCQPEEDFEVEAEPIMDGEGPNPAYGCGSTSVVMVVLGGETPAILVANAGDSRAVLCRGGRAVPLSHDHKPHLREEGERIRRAGGSVTNGRVDGNLNLSRSLGDLTFKQDLTLPPAEQRISAMPDVRICPLTDQDEFVVLACDGIWDCKSNQQVIDFVRSRLVDHEQNAEDYPDGKKPDDSTFLAKVCEELCDECLSSNPSESEGVGCDNMTVIVVQLSKDFVKKANHAPREITLYGKQTDTYL